MKGWHNEPGRHSLASKGISTTQSQLRRSKVDEDYIAAQLRVNEYIDSNSVSTYYYDDAGFAKMSFSIKDEFTSNPSNIPSSIVYNIKESTLEGALRFPMVTKGAIDYVESGFDTIKDDFEPELSIRFTHKDDRAATPHVDFAFENVTAKNLESKLREVNNIVKEMMSE